MLWGDDKPAQGMIRVEGYDNTTRPVFGDLDIEGTVRNGDEVKYRKNAVVGIWDKFTNNFDTWFGSEESQTNFTIAIKENSEGEKVLSVRTRMVAWEDATETVYKFNNWLDQYGMPSYFTIALHVGTMAPDFSYAVANFIQPKVTIELIPVKSTITLNVKQGADSCANGKHVWVNGGASKLVNTDELYENAEKIFQALLQQYIA